MVERRRSREMGIPAAGRNMMKYYLAGLAALLTFVVYFSTLGHEFVNWDDNEYIYENPHIRSFDLSFFRWAFFDFYAANWHPLTWISHALDYAVWGLNPLGHHLTNNILHAVNTFLVVLLVVRLIEESKQYAVSSEQKQKDNKEYEVSGKKTSANRESSPASGRFAVDESSSSGESGTLPKDYRKRPDFPSHVSHLTPDASRSTLIVAGVTGLLFGLHPIHVESVAWVAERKDLLCALFYLLSVMAYIKYATRRQAQGDNNVMVSRSNRLSLLFFILALMSKPMAVSLPVVLLILDWYPFNRITSLKTFMSSLAEKIPFIALGIGSAVLTILAQKSAGAMGFMKIMPLSTRTLVAFKSLVGYIMKMLAPTDLIPLYTYPRNISLFSVDYLLPVALVTGITFLCTIMIKRQKVWMAVWGYYVVSLIPVLGIVQVGGQAMADRYTYLPGLGPLFVIGLAAARIWERLSAPGRRGLALRSAVAAAAILAVSSAACLTVRQTGIWKNSIDLWSYVIEKEPLKVNLAYYMRGAVYQEQGLLDKAIADYNMVNALEPFHFEVYQSLGSIYEKMGMTDKAIEDYSMAIAINPRAEKALVSRGILYGKAGLFDRAIEDFDKAVEVNPDYPAAYVNRGTAYSLMGQDGRALGDFSKAIEVDSNYVSGYLNRGSLYLKRGDRERAAADYRMACALGSPEGCDALQGIQENRRPGP